MRLRTLLLLALAISLAGGTAMLARSWLTSQRLQEFAKGAPILAAKPAASVLVARADLRRGQILRPDDMIWQVWPDGAIDKNYIVLGGPRTPEAFAGSVVKNPVAGGEPISAAKIISPEDRGFLAAVLAPGMRAISVPVTRTSGISGFIFPGDRVDLLISYPVPSAKSAQGDATRPNYEHRASQTVLQDIRVIGIDQQLDGKPGETVIAQTATFEVTPKQSEIIALASEIGKVSLTLRSLVPAPGDTAQAAEPAHADNRSGADSPLSQTATYTIDSDIIPLLPRRSSRTQAAASSDVTILRGGGKANQTKASEPAGKGS